jgi:hypothetical protein
MFHLLDWTIYVYSGEDITYTPSTNQEEDVRINGLLESDATQWPPPERVCVSPRSFRPSASWQALTLSKQSPFLHSILYFLDFANLHFYKQLRERRKMPSSGMLSRMALDRSDVSEYRITYIIKVTRIDELGTTLAVTSNRSTFFRNVGSYKKTFVFLRFEAFAVVTMKNSIFWDVTPCGSCRIRNLRGTYRIHRRGGKIHRARNNVSSH